MTTVPHAYSGTTVVACEDLMGLLDLSDEEPEFIEIIPKEPRNPHKSKGSPSSKHNGRRDSINKGDPNNQRKKRKSVSSLSSTSSSSTKTSSKKRRNGKVAFDESSVESTSNTTRRGSKRVRDETKNANCSNTSNSKSRKERKESKHNVSSSTPKESGKKKRKSIPKLRDKSSAKSRAESPKKKKSVAKLSETCFSAEKTTSPLRRKSKPKLMSKESKSKRNSKSSKDSSSSSSSSSYSSSSSNPSNVDDTESRARRQSKSKTSSKSRKSSSSISSSNGNSSRSSRGSIPSLIPNGKRQSIKSSAKRPSKASVDQKKKESKDSKEKMSKSPRAERRNSRKSKEITKREKKSKAQKAPKPKCNESVSKSPRPKLSKNSSKEKTLNLNASSSTDRVRQSQEFKKSKSKSMTTSTSTPQPKFVKNKTVPDDEVRDKMSMNSLSPMSYRPDRPRSKSPQPPPESMSPTQSVVDIQNENANSINSNSIQSLKAKRQSLTTSASALSAVSMDDDALLKALESVLREEWTIGSKVEVFSMSQSLWIGATVIKIISSLEGDWLKLVYDDGECWKNLLRSDQYVRPLMPSLNLHDATTRQKAIDHVMKRNINRSSSASSSSLQMTQWRVSQKCEFKDPHSNGLKKSSVWKWGEIWQRIHDEHGLFVILRYLHNNDELQQCSIDLQRHGACLRATIPRDGVGAVIGSKWHSLKRQVMLYPEESVEAHLAARALHLRSMADVYKKMAISSWEEMPKSMEQLLEAQRIKLLPILVLDVENTLVPTRLIRSVRKKNEMAMDTVTMMRNMDEWIENAADHNYKYLKPLQRILRQNGSVVDALIASFCGKIAILSEGGLSQWDQLVDAMPASCGGDSWRNIYKMAMRESDAMSLFSAKSAFLDEHKSNGRGGGGGALDTDDVISSKRMVLQYYLKSIRMGMEYERLKDESYFIPVLCAVGDDETDMSAVDEAVSGVFEDFYVLTKFKLTRNKLAVNSLTENVIAESLRKLMQHPRMKTFLREHDGDRFKKETWHQVLSGDVGSHHRLFKL